ncbi:MAG: DUF4139 domain-containing protein [Terriglobia bacterium]
MGRRIILALAASLLFGAAVCWPQAPRLTIYNQNFAVVRVQTPLDLKQGVNQVQLSNVTAYLEPDSVILRDPSGQYPLRILEQNYRADPVSQGSMLRMYEGKQINFLVVEDGRSEIVPGKIIRSGYEPPPRYVYPQPYGVQPPISEAPRQPIIEVNGQIRFSLPGQPLFPALTQGSILKPELDWTLESEKAGHVNAELSYITQQIDWQATYNVVEAAADQALNLLGWVTIHNRSGKTFENASIKLMAGTVNRVQPQSYARMYAGVVGGVPGGVSLADRMHPLVTQAPFDEYHLYELHRPVTLLDQETKQVEFIRASGIQSDRYYVYDGLRLPPNQYNGWNMEMIRQNREFGTESNRDVRVMREFANTSANHLGIPLPAGRLRFYREDQDSSLEFLGENEIPHTPENESVKVYTGNAFDLSGDRTRTNYTIDNFRRMLDESFEIRLNNHKQQPVEVRVVEHLYRGDTWEITQHSNAFVKQDSHTIEFRVQVRPNGQKVVTYTVHYTW